MRVSSLARTLCIGTVVTGLLVACKTTEERVAQEKSIWSRPGSTPEEFQADRTACVNAIQREFDHNTWPKPVGRMSMAQRSMEARWWAEREFPNCMQGKGWVSAPGERVRAPAGLRYP